ncbi:hypothetical protein SAMN05660226_01249 [Parapedobacter luteus]|uniref:Uncharacterized protein n=1 Tax=Parapedobacter luteus TaxID=623280 RepID=A0A1T5B111_9SPHI|nr:hypothetical protein [Parapedobacter luteus]SKB40938.1 hypothetical protein SAMN05660226_01249 [Parapedobacter luteus]
MIVDTIRLSLMLLPALKKGFYLKSDISSWALKKADNAFRKIFEQDLENSWRGLRTAYTGNFKDPVYGQLPEEEAILTTLKMITARLNSVTWTIRP